MGVVIRQSLWSTVIAYLGVVVGYINTLFLRPAFLNVEEIGLFTLVTSNALLFSSFSTLGMNGAFIKVFPTLRLRERSVLRLVTFMLVCVLLVDFLLMGMAWLFEGWINQFFESKSPSYIKYLWVSGFILIFHSLFEILLAYSRSMMSVVWPTFLRDVFLRLGTTVILLLYGFNIIEFPVAIHAIFITFAAAFVVFTLHLILRHQFSLDWSILKLPQPEFKQFLWLSGYMLLLSGSYSTLQNVSYLQLATLKGLEAQGIFVTCFYIGMIVDMPRRNMLKIISPLFAQAFQKKDLNEVNKMYQRGSITLSVIGLLIFIGIVTNVQDLFAFIPKGTVFQSGMLVVVLVCLTKVITMLFGFSAEVLVFSDHYRYNLYLQGGAALLLIFLNMWLIPLMGINGAATGYALSMILLFVMRYALIKKLMQLTPFTLAHAKLMGIALFTFIVFYHIPWPFTPILNILIRSMATTVVFGTLIFYFRISSDINQLVRSTFDRIAK